MAIQPVTKPVLAALPTEIDAANARAMHSHINAAIMKPEVRVVIADMTETVFCDSVGVRMLLLAHKQAIRDSAELRLLRPGPAVVRVLALLGVDRVLRICGSPEEAGTALTPQPWGNDAEPSQKSALPARPAVS